MKNIIILMACATAFTACKPTTDKVPQAGEATAPRSETSARSVEADRSTTQQKLSGQLDALDAKMAELKERAQRAGDQAKVEWETRRPQLEAQRESAAKRLEELKQSGKETWGETSRKTEAAFEELEKGFKEAWARIKE